jgi:hypothetical protein
MDEDYVDVEQLSDSEPVVGGGPLRAKAVPIKSEIPLATSHPYKKHAFPGSFREQAGSFPSQGHSHPNVAPSSFHTAPWVESLYSTSNTSTTSHRNVQTKTPPNSLVSSHQLQAMQENIAELERSLFGTEIKDDLKIEGEMSYGMIVGITDSDGELDPNQTDEEDLPDEDWTYNPYAQFDSHSNIPNSYRSYESYDAQLHGSLPSTVAIHEAYARPPTAKKNSPKKTKKRNKNDDDAYDDYEAPVQTRPRSSSTGSATGQPVHVGSISSLIVMTNDPSMPKAYQCPHDGCGKLYKNPGGVKYHLAHGHAVFKPYRCIVPECDKRYRNAGGLVGFC